MATVEHERALAHVGKLTPSASDLPEGEMNSARHMSRVELLLRAHIEHHRRTPSSDLFHQHRGRNFPITQLISYHPSRFLSPNHQSPNHKSLGFHFKPR